VQSPNLNTNSFPFKGTQSALERSPHTTIDANIGLGMVGDVKFNIKQPMISLSAIAISVALAGCGGDGDKAESKKKSGGTPPKASDNQKPASQASKDTFGGERDSIAGSKQQKGGDTDKPLPEPPKDSLAAFLWGKKIVFKKVQSNDRNLRMFIFGKNGKLSMAVETPEGFVDSGRPPIAFEVDGLKVKFAEIFTFSSKVPKVGDTVTIGREDRVAATLSIEKIFGPDENANIKEVPKSVFKRANMMKSISGAVQMANEMIGFEADTEKPFPADWGGLILKQWGSQEGLRAFISPRSTNYEKLRAQLKTQLEAGKEIKKEERISHYAINKSMIGKSSFDAEDPNSTVFIFECEMGWNGAGGLEDALKFMDKHKLDAIAVTMVTGGGKPVTREELKKLTWKVGP